ncbi:proteasome assembly chaperone family protein [Vulcanisaeta souniana]|uniref:Carboxylate--amine ligase n=1 Tax=Vulcanisaeta souniana JCM 11219 TaxID=1293586 RepID=A0A830E1B9_9CREN|nr:PAC2 family protein [Vulcanisaeta souniana]BDR91398.1 carboxylate--amine ligase [Vulcanisaeta souniana JCM 11219]GGI72869.1 carboxylate--amine ligase [Vulcanisaeta souniana JCM 11219]
MSSTAVFDIKIKSIPRDPRNTLIMACPEPSLASIVAIEYLVETLKMEEIGSIKPRGHIPIVTVINGAAKLPYRLFFDREHAIVVIRQHVPIPPMLYDQFVNKILDWAEDNSVGRVVCLTSTSLLTEQETDNVYFVSEESHTDEYRQMGLMPLQETTITGIEAVFLDSVLSRNINGVLLLAESKVLTAINKLIESGKISSHKDVLAILNQMVGRYGPDVTAALKLIKALSKVVGFEIPADKLAEHANKYAFLVDKNLEMYMKPPKEELPVFY